MEYHYGTVCNAWFRRAWEHEPVKKEPSNEPPWILEFLSELGGENAALLQFIRVQGQLTLICHHKDWCVKSLERKLLQEKLAYILKADGLGKLQQCRFSGPNKWGDLKVLERLTFAHVLEEFSVRIGKVEKKHWLSKSRIIGVDYVWKK